MDATTLIMWFFLIAGALLFLFRTFWPGQPGIRPDLLAGGLLCWIIAYILERVG